MTFAQALARIEEISTILNGPTTPKTICKLQPELLELLDTHADSIVQLGKAAEKLASTVTAGASIGARGERDLYQQARGLQALLKGEK